MKSTSTDPHAGNHCFRGGALWLSALTLLSVVSAGAQPVPASIATVLLPVGGRPHFDSAGNTYHLDGPPTSGAAQTRAGGGTCLLTTNLLITVPQPCPDARVSKFDASGRQVWGTLLGGPAADSGTVLAVDRQGNVLLVGETSGEFPTTPGVAIESTTSAKAFAARISADGAKILYATYLPDTLAAASALAVDAAGSAYVAGKTSAGRALVLKLSPDGARVDYTATFGSGAESITAIAVDPAGNAILTGHTTSPDFPITPGAFQTRLKGSRNGFLLRLDPAGQILSSTYFGGSGQDLPSLLAIDRAGNIVLAGSTTSLDLETTVGTLQASAMVPAWNNQSPAGFVAQFVPDGTSLKWATYVPSADAKPSLAAYDVGVSALALGLEGDIYLGGRAGVGYPVTASAPVFCFPATGGSPGMSGFLVHLTPDGALLDATYFGGHPNGQPIEGAGDVLNVGGVVALADRTILIAWREFAVLVSRIRFGSGGWTAPACLSAEVVNSATQAGGSWISPGELVTLTGLGIGPEFGVAGVPGADGRLTTELAGVQVLFNGVPAPLLYAQSRQVNTVVPPGLAVDTTARIAVLYNGRQFGPVAAKTVFSRPGIFRLQSGQSAQAVAINQDGTLNRPTNPAARGSVVAFWGTGFGPTDPPCRSGGLNLPYAAPLGRSTRVLMNLPVGGGPGPTFPFSPTGFSPQQLPLEYRRNQPPDKHLHTGNLLG